MKWKDKYSVGIEKIDTQHKALLRLLSTAQEAVATGQSYSVLHFAMLETVQYAERHFRFEEALMRLYGFPGYEEHAEAHGKILAKVAGLVGESLAADRRDQVAAFLSDWLVTHIQGSDRAYARHILSGARCVTPQQQIEHPTVRRQPIPRPMDQCVLIS